MPVVRRPPKGNRKPPSTPPPAADAKEPAVAVTSRAPRWAMAGASSLLLIALAVAQHAVGRQASFTLLYLLPVLVATWFAGQSFGGLVAVLAAFAGLLNAWGAAGSVAMSLWNAAGKLGVYLVFSILVVAIHQSPNRGAMLRQMRQMLAACVGSAFVLAALGWMIERHMPPTPTEMAAAASASLVSDEGPELSPTATTPQQLLEQLVARTQESMQLSRPVLLGSRDPKGPSCVSVVRSGDLKGSRPNVLGDWNGGPGTTMAMLYNFDRQEINSALADYNWHQNRLRQYLENEITVNLPVARKAHELAALALQFSKAADGWSEFPAAAFTSPISFSGLDDWPSFCMTSLVRAVGSKDLAATKHWAGELATATMSLDDMHAWLTLLADNHLRALDFQKQCEGLFVESNPKIEKYEPAATISQFPAGVLSLNGWGNYSEIERQAERLFSMPPDRVAEINSNDHLTPSSRWVLPGVREAFVTLQNALGPDNRATWEQAARTPYEHCYLVNMLFRASSAGTVDEMVGVLKKIDAIHPKATVGELMSVLMYRGHAFAGMEWADRFQPELQKAAASIPTSMSDGDAFVAAGRWTSDFYHTNAQYGLTFTLRDALDQRKLDCVRATDMIGAVYRNAGRTRFGNVRICAGTFAHSVAAYMGRTADDKPDVKVYDGLMASSQSPETFPECYFKGHAYPPGMENNPPPYCVELYIRGLDSYVWSEGYIIRGPNAGTFSTAGIAYSTHHREQKSEKIFNGPFPQ